MGDRTHSAPSPASHLLAEGGAIRSDRLEEPRYRPSPRAWVLFLLLAANAVNFMDRQIFAVLQSPMKHELKLTDFQLGVISGPTFAIFFAAMGLPIARLVERYNRSWLLSLSIGLWSCFAALCGTATGFIQLALCRIGLGVGEAGCTPTAHSLIGDYFPPEQRARAMSAYTSGLCLGTFCGALLSGALAATWGWRAAFMIIGLPGIILAVLTKFTLRETPRGGSEPAGSRHYAKGRDPLPSLRKVIAYIGRRPTIWALITAHTFGAFAIYGLGAFTPTYFVRVFHLPLPQIGLITGVAAGLFAGLGALLGAWFADRYSRRDPRFYCLIPAVSLAVAIPLTVAIYFAPDWRIAAALFALSQMLVFAYLTPMFALLNVLMEPRMRATAAALILLISGVIGNGMGPLLVGAASDYFASQSYNSAGYVRICTQAVGAVGQAGEACARASVDGLRSALVLCAGVILLIIASFIVATRTVRRDIAA